MSGPREAVAAAGIRERVRALLGPEGVRDREGAPESVPEARPASDEEAGALLRLAGEEGWRVLPLGRGLAPDPGMPDLLVSTRRRTGITELEAADLTLTAEAGTTLEELNRSVRAEGQWLPLDPPGGEEVTLGGLTAMGLGGPLATGFGRPRDQLLGLTLVDGEGRTLRLGGRVVKNVAGFDLVRLAAGSRGALGVITSVSLRLFPLPRLDRTLVWERADRKDAWDLARTLSHLPLPLAALELISGPWGKGVPGEGPRVVCRVLGSGGTVEGMSRRLEEAAGAPEAVRDGEEGRALFGHLAKLEGRGAPALRARALPDRGGALLEAAGSLEVALRRHGAAEAADARVALRPATGELRLGMTGEAAPGPGAEATARAVEAFRRRVEELGGSLRPLRVPGPLAGATASATPRSPRAADLERRLRRAFDPLGILPGAWRDGPS